MVLIEALKQINDLNRKADDLRKKVAKHCAITSLQKSTYENQRSTIDGWIQAYKDILKEILNLRLAIQRTNLDTKVVIELGGKQVTKSIAGWIHRRRDLAQREQEIYDALTDRGIIEGTTQVQGGDRIEIEIVRFFDPKTRDEKRELYAGERSIIDGKLEIVNATTDLIE